MKYLTIACWILAYSMHFAVLVIDMKNLNHHFGKTLTIDAYWKMLESPWHRWTIRFLWSVWILLSLTSHILFFFPAFALILMKAFFWHDLWKVINDTNDRDYSRLINYFRIHKGTIKANKVFGSV